MTKRPIRLSFLDTLLQDLRYAFRTLRRDKGFAAFAILIAGLGIGASCTVFSVLNALLLHPPPFREPERLVWLANRDVSGLSGQTTQVGAFLDLRERSQSFSDLAAYFAFYGMGDNLLSGSGEPERLTGVPVSANFFQLLGVQPQVGRLFTADECKWHGPKAVLLSHGLWERRFGSDTTIAGRTVVINNEPYTVAGVLPATFDFASVFAPGSRIDLFFPFPLTPETNRWGNTLAIIGRLKPGIGIGAAQAEVRILAAQISAAHPERNTFEGNLSPLADHVSGRIRLALLVLAGAVAVVMLIVCANLSNLLLARTAARQKEIAVRTALGAGRWRIVRQMLTEGIVLSSSGAALGVALAFAGTRGLARLQTVSIPLLASVRVDPTALGFTVALAVFTGLVFGLAPALQVRTAALHDALKDTNRGSTGGKPRVWLRSALVVSEIAFACVLLVGACLLVRSFIRVLDVNLGFQPENAVTVRIEPETPTSTQAQLNAYFDDALRRVRDIPGIQAAGLTDSLPLGMNRSWGAPEKGHTYPKGRFPEAFVRVVSDGYIKAMGIPIRAGRDISDRDTPATDPVMVINQTMARTLFPGEEALGRVISACGDRHVVGVVGDVRHLALEQDAGLEMYIPMRQCRDISSVHLVVRSSLLTAQLAAAVRAALKPIAPNIPGNDFQILQQLVDRSVSPRRFIVLLIAGFAAFALILASLGIYGVISYSVNQRTQEIGIRMALGASAGALQASILMQTMSLAGIGMLAGAAASCLLFEVTASDPLTFFAMLLVLTTVTAIAGYLPARRASRIDPSVALRAN